MRMVARLAAAAMLLGTGVAHATYVPATWEDPITDFSPFGCSVSGAAYLSSGDSCSYYHDITDGAGGFQTFPTDIVDDYSLWLNLYDDQSSDGSDWARVDMPGLLGDRTFFSLTGTESGGVSVAGFLQLNTLGLLSVTVESLRGDFFLGGSRLIATGVRSVRSVPEPATLALLGLGLIGLGLLRRRNR